jgi:hypothetical protein
MKQMGMRKQPLSTICIAKKMHKDNGVIDGGVSKKNLQQDH